MPHGILIRLFVAVLLISGLLGTGSLHAAPNVLVVMTDDQRFDAISRMPNVMNLASQGVRFTNAYVTTPLCAPSRASMFSGGFLAKNTGVLDNKPPNGGAQLFNDDQNFGKVMQGAGYQTLYVGKWINEYWVLGKYVPPGWTRFAGRRSDVLRTDWSNDILYVIGSSGATSSTGNQVTLSGQYIAYYERDRILDFLDQARRDRPFFVFWSTAAPHAAATPAPGDETLFASYLYRDRGYGEADLSDKPAWVRNRKVTGIDDEFVRDQLRSVQSVDRSLAAIVNKLKALGRYNDTVIIFTSDNGFQWGEHSYLWTNKYAYEESILVPLVVVMPGVGSRVDKHLVAANLDLAPTLYDLAGVSRASDGKSLVPLLRNPSTSWRQQLFFEGYSTEKLVGYSLWTAVRRNQWKCIKHWSGEAPFAWKVESGQLPRGLTLDAGSGVIRGTPSAAGTFEFTVRVTDSSMATQARHRRTFVSTPLTLRVTS